MLGECTMHARLYFTETTMKAVLRKFADALCFTAEHLSLVCFQANQISKTNVIWAPSA